MYSQYREATQIFRREHAQAFKFSLPLFAETVPAACVYLRKSKQRGGGRERDMATTNVVARNRLVAGALMGFVSLTYGYTMIRMKNTTASVMDEFANSPAKDAGK